MQLIIRRNKNYLRTLEGSIIPKIERTDIIAILNIFNRCETILDFAESSFLIFTMKSIGINLIKEYRGSIKK